MNKPDLHKSSLPLGSARFSRIIFYVIAAFTVLNILAFVLQLFSWGYYHNSDALYVPALVRDVFELGNSPWSWSFPPAPYFFPDFFAYWLIDLLLQDTNHSIIAYGLLQSLLCLGVWIFIFRIVDDRPVTTILSALTVFFFFLPQNYRSALIPEYSSLMSFHFGAWLISLICLMLVVKGINEPGKIKTLSLAFLTILTTLSDPLFLLFFTFPTLCAYCHFSALYTARREGRALNLLVILCGSVLGWLLHTMLSPHLYNPSLNPLKSGFSLALSSLNHWLFNHLTLANVPLLLVGVYVIYQALRVILGRNRHITSARDPFPFMLLFFGYLAVFVVGALFLVAKLEHRYCFPVFHLSILLFPLCFSRNFWPASSSNVPRYLPFIAVGATVIAFGLTFANLREVTRKEFSLRWPLVTSQCVAKQLTSEPPFGVLANYWDAKRLFVAMDKEIYFTALNDELVPYHWISNRDWSKHPIHYVIVNNAKSWAFPDKRFTLEAVEERFGKAERRIACNDLLILVYRDELKLTD